MREGDVEFCAPGDVERGLASAGYLADAEIVTAVYLAGRLGKPVLVEGPAGTGKTELAESVSRLRSRIV